jgi:hypothetical protein
MPVSQRTVQACLFILAAIALFGGVLQMSLGQPDTTPRLDNVHRFLAGIYLGCGIIAAWAAITIREQGTLIYLIALGDSAASSRWPRSASRTRRCSGSHMRPRSSSCR